MPFLNQTYKPHTRTYNKIIPRIACLLPLLKSSNYSFQAIHVPKYDTSFLLIEAFSLRKIMCSIFGPMMDSFQGDLTDIIRASGASYGSSCSTGTISSSEPAPFSHDHHHWQFSSDPINFSSVLEDPRGNFGDPFSNIRDPFLHELDMSGSAYFNSTSSAEISSSGGLEEAATCFGGGGGGGVIGSSSNTSVLAQKIVENDMRRSCNSILLNMTQISHDAKLPISPCDSPVMAASPRVLKPSAVVSGNMINANTSKDHCLVDNTRVQISSPRNQGLKRRKSQAKKSICIPAPAAQNSRQSGEIVPSDLWFWRKYGQKPIKGSPYPRGYYRCSSSKGCPARKQVERSRTDPNMLVITYTSEHNHPWPTQRNVLAGSTRSQLSNKNNIATSKNSETTQHQKGTTTKPDQEEQQESNSDSNVSPVIAAVKEEINSIEKQLEMDDGEFMSNGLPYKPCKLKCKQLEDFFEELGEIEADSLNLLSPKGFNAVDDRESKALDPFHLFDWSGDNSTKYHLI